MSELYDSDTDEIERRHREQDRICEAEAIAAKAAAETQLLENIIADLFGVLEGVRREHMDCSFPSFPCDCGANKHNAKIDAALERARTMRAEK